MKTRATLVTALAILLSGAVAAATVYVTVIRLPDPRSASGRGLMRWLVQRELAHEPAHIQRTLVERLVEALPTMLDRSGDVELSERQRSLLERNIRHLKYVWFQSRVDELFRLPSDQHDAFLDAQLATISTLTSLGPRLEQITNPQASVESWHDVVSFIREVDDWIAEASGSQQAKMIQGVKLGTSRWLMTHDLAQESLALRAALAERIALELDEGASYGSVIDGCSSEEADRLTANAQLLMEAWFFRCAEFCAQLTSRTDKATYADRQIERIEAWDVSDYLPTGARGSSDTTSGMQELARLVQTWIGRAPLDRRPELNSFLLILQQRYFVRVMGWGEKN